MSWVLEARGHAGNHPREHRCKHVALIQSGKQTIVGFNQKKTHPLQFRFSKNPDKIHMHAEIDAIAQASRLGLDLRKANLFVARFTGDVIKQSKPCRSCWSALIAFGFRSVSWTTERGTVETYYF